MNVKEIGSKISIKTLTGKENNIQDFEFTIPIYQRKYAWQEEQIYQLINDLQEFEGDNKYFIGNIVVEEIYDNKFAVIDGQQRLTTLYLMSLVSGKKNFKFSYDVREDDKLFLEEIAQKEKIDENFIDEKAKELKPDIQLVSNIKAILKRKEDLDEIFEKIKFAFTILKKDEVDIAKYFEVMNSRGKQLQQHQILKAMFLECIKDDKEKEIYARLWDYCSRMDVYIEDFIYQYEKMEYDKNKRQNRASIAQEKLRHELIVFAQTNKPETEKVFEFFKKSINDSNNESKNTISILKALEASKNNEEKEKIGVDKYRSFLKFEYFLLHVLSLSRDNKYIIFKDTKLIDQYKDKLQWLKNGNDDKDKNAKEFLNELFRYRILFDYFFFKRYKKEGDVLHDEPYIAKLTKQQKENDEDIRRILNLQLLFNFTTDFFAQHWIRTVLKWLIENESKFLESDFYNNYANFLEFFDTTVMVERLKDESNLQKVYLGYEKNGENDEQIESERLNNFLHKGTSTQQYWFYKLDYLLWKNYDWDKKEFNSPFSETEKFKYKEIKQKFRLSRLNSVEHIFPQSKKEQWIQSNESCDDCSNEPDRRIDCFGNLALVSQRFNSTLSDDSENKKLKIQEQLNRGTIESLKMLIFYSNVESSKSITLENCKVHQKEMIDILCNQVGKQT